MSSSISMDINCDVGEGIGNEALLMPSISSCNIACGAHAGNVSIIDEVIALAKSHRVKIGAHPSFPDRENFGRKIMNVSSEVLQKSVEDQILLLVNRAQAQNVTLHHVKPHGALYNLIAEDALTAQIVVDAIKNVVPHTFIYVPFASEIEKVAQRNGLRIKYEAFADRNYNPDLTLVSRSEKNALITAKEDVLQHVEQIVFQNSVHTSNGSVTIKADTLCVHGDTQNAVALAACIHQYLTAKNILIV